MTFRFLAVNDGEMMLSLMRIYVGEMYWTLQDRRQKNYVLELINFRLLRGILIVGDCWRP